MQARVLGVRIDCLGMGAALARIEQLVDEGGHHLVATVNPEFVMGAQRDREFARVLDSAALCPPDGTGVVWAARRQGWYSIAHPIEPRTIYVSLQRPTEVRARRRAQLPVHPIPIRGAMVRLMVRLKVPLMSLQLL